MRARLKCHSFPYRPSYHCNCKGRFIYRPLRKKTSLITHNHSLHKLLYKALSKNPDKSAAEKRTEIVLCRRVKCESRTTEAIPIVRLQVTPRTELYVR